MRRILLWVTVTALVPAAVLIDTGAFLLGSTDASPAVVNVTGADGERYGAPGPHPIGLAEIAVLESLDALVWYPAAAPVEGRRPSAAYTFDLQLGAPLDRVWLGTFAGRATRGADVAEGSHPLVVLSPGFAMSSSSYAWLGEHLASHGFVVVSPDHDEQLDPGRLGLAAVARPEDIRAVLDLVESAATGAGWLGAVDVDRVAVIGHSLGGFTALAAGGARLDTAAFERRCATASEEVPQSAWLCGALLPQVPAMADAAGLDAAPDDLWPTMGDPRVDAVVSMAGDAFLFDRDGLAEITVPMLAIGGTEDHDSPYEWSSRLAYDGVSSGVKEIVPLDGAGHMVFANPCETTRRLLDLMPNDFCPGDPSERAAAHRVIAARTTQFLTEALTSSPVEVRG